MVWTPRAFSSHSDANRLWISGVKPVLLGPGQLQMAHAPEEFVSFSQIQCAAELYLYLIVSMGSLGLRRGLRNKLNLYYPNRASN